MEQIQELFALAGNGAGPSGATAVAMALLFAFAAGQVIAWSYSWTHTGVSYSRSFVQALVLIAVVVSLVMMIVGSNVIVAFGLFGALAVIRFRNVLKDTRDTAFIFMEVAVGLGAGTMNYLVTGLGVAFFVLVALYLKATSFGAIDSYDALVRFEAHERTGDQVDALFDRHCQRAELVTRRWLPSGESENLSYRLVLRDLRRADSMVSELKSIPGVERVSILMQGEQAEL